MKRALKTKSSIYKFLEPYLDSGNEEQIAFARKEYSRIYKAGWRKNQRHETKQFTIAFTPSEAKLVTDVAKKHHRHTSPFIKEACFAYMNKTYLIHDTFAIHTIAQLLALNYNSLNKLLEEHVIQYQLGRDILTRHIELEQKILSELKYPKTLEETITDTIKANPPYKETLLLFIQNVQV